jgi:hypothetical protein
MRPEAVSNSRPPGLPCFGTMPDDEGEVEGDLVDRQASGDMSRIEPS